MACMVFPVTMQLSSTHIVTTRGLCCIGLSFTLDGDECLRTGVVSSLEPRLCVRPWDNYVDSARGVVYIHTLPTRGCNSHVRERCELVRRSHRKHV